MAQPEPLQGGWGGRDVGENLQGVASFLLPVQSWVHDAPHPEARTHFLEARCAAQEGKSE